MLNAPFIPKYSRSSRSPAVTKGGTIYYPLWLSYATGALEKAGHSVKLVDAPAVPFSEAETLEIVREFKPDMTVLDTSTASIKNDVSVLEKIKKSCNCFGVLVGPHVSALPAETMKMSREIDAVCVQEYDYTLRELAEELEKENRDLARVKGIVFRKNKEIIQNPFREKIENLDELPFVSGVYKKHLNYKDYFYSANRWPEVTIVTGRGCPFNCSFCNWVQNLNPGKYRKRSIANVI
ncbi:MAG: cobalamin-dependent protein, partial [Candidatus Diapherotrites archaeon]|nr:cobalamin-dependent protein [Candidatus Diapherotrites archaeon]